MHKDKGNGIVMMLKFASTFFSITLLGFLICVRMFLFHLKLPFFTRQHTIYTSLAHFLVRSFKNWFFFVSRLIDLWFQLALIYGHRLLNFIHFEVRCFDCLSYSPVDWFCISSAYDSSSEFVNFIFCLLQIFLLIFRINFSIITLYFCFKLIQLYTVLATFESILPGRSFQLTLQVSFDFTSKYLTRNVHKKLHFLSLNLTKSFSIILFAHVLITHQWGATVT